MLVLALAFNAFVVALACIGMMVIFMGGNAPALILLLALSLPLSTLTLLGGFVWFVRTRGLRQAPAAIWKAVPQWLAITFWLAAALIFCGELALLVTLQLAEEAPRFWQHLPLLAGILGAVSYCVLHAVRNVKRTQSGIGYSG